MRTTALALTTVLSLSAFAQEASPTPEAAVEATPTPVPTAKVRGRLLEKGTRAPLADVNLFFLPSQTKATTDGAGNFEADVPAGTGTVVVNAAGYDRLEAPLNVVPNLEIRKVYYLERVSYQGDFETVVVGKKLKDSTQKGLSQKQFAAIPGAGGDAIKAVSNLAGVNRPPGFDSNVVIQGSGLTQTAYMIDGHEVPLVFHFGGLSTVVFSEAIDSVDFFSAGYGPQYSRALGGLVGVTLRSPRADRWRGLAFVDLLNAGGLVEGGWGDHAVLFSIRQSYIGQVLKLATKGNDDFALSVAPRFTDLTAMYEYKPNALRRFRLSTVGSLDAVELVLKNPAGNDPFLRGDFENDTRFLRLIPQYSATLSDALAFDASMGLGWTKFRFDAGDDFLDIRSYSITPRTEWRWDLNDRTRWTSGMDHRIEFTKIDVILPNDYAPGGVFNPFAGGKELSVAKNAVSVDLGLYSKLSWQPAGTPWTFIPGARVDYFHVGRDAFVDPRAAVFFDVDPSLRLRTQGGRYHQPNDARETDGEVGNPDLKVPQAWHLSLAADKDFRGGGAYGLTASAGPFFRWFDDLSTRSNALVVRNGETVPEFFNSSTEGRAFGGETSVRYTQKSWELALAYMVLRSRLEEPGIGEYRSPYDQTHNVNLIAGVNFGKNWRLSTRVRYVTGNPYTPIVAASFDADHGVFTPERGEYFGARVADFFQWDVRLDKKWIYERWILSLYLDVQNATNRRNQENVEYAYDYGSLVTSSGLPILPALGLKGEF